MSSEITNIWNFVFYPGSNNSDITGKFYCLYPNFWCVCFGLCVYLCISVSLCIYKYESVFFCVGLWDWARVSVDVNVNVCVCHINQVGVNVSKFFKSTDLSIGLLVCLPLYTLFLERCHSKFQVRQLTDTCEKECQLKWCRFLIFDRTKAEKMERQGRKKNQAKLKPYSLAHSTKTPEYTHPIYVDTCPNILT